MSNSLLPPRARNWTPGTNQIGLFIRDANGGVVEGAFNNVDLETAKQVADILVKLGNRKKEGT